ncbi:MAG TPA: hypothetical protein VGM05_14320 [Planctomycetaceae bacterium]|jgi:hypothetical protein
MVVAPGGAVAANGGALLVLPNQGNPALNGPDAKIFIGLGIAQIVLWITNLVLLFVPATKDWCSEQTARF